MRLSEFQVIFQRRAFKRAMRTRKSYITEQQAGRCSFQGDQNPARKELCNINAASQVKCIVGRDTMRVVTVTENFGGLCQCTLCRHCYHKEKQNKTDSNLLFARKLTPA